MLTLLCLGSQSVSLAVLLPLGVLTHKFVVWVLEQRRGSLQGPLGDSAYRLYRGRPSPCSAHIIPLMSFPAAVCCLPPASCLLPCLFPRRAFSPNDTSSLTESRVVSTDPSWSAHPVALFWEWMRNDQEHWWCEVPGLPSGVVGHFCSFTCTCAKGIVTWESTSRGETEGKTGCYRHTSGVWRLILCRPLCTMRNWLCPPV